jgi:hypothetical protein
MSELMSFIDGLIVDEGRLPLVHVSDVFRLVNMRTTGVLKLPDSSDQVFPGEHLLYFFYGRPSYRINHNIGSTRLPFFAPVCLVMKHQLIKDAFRIMPFDTGAYGTSLTSSVIHPDMKMAEFSLDVHPRAPMKLIKTFYGSELDYLNSAPLQNIVGVDDNPHDTRFHVQAYNHLLRFKANERADDRLHAVEIQINQEVCIAGNAAAVILPDRWADDDDFRKCIEKDWGAIAIPYDLPEQYNPREHMGQIFSKVKTFIVQNSMHDE